MKIPARKHFVRAAWLALVFPLLGFAESAAPSALKFEFGSGSAASGFTAVSPSTVYTKELGYGFEPGAAVQALNRGGDPSKAGCVTATPLFKFSVAVPEGNYRVTVTLGDAGGKSETTVKSEQARLMLEHVATQAGEIMTRTFFANVRTPKLSPGNEMKLDVREIDPKTHEAVSATWDGRLTLQFSGARPCVAAVEIEPVTDAITVFLIGDSTVTDQGSEPFGTWGQLLPRWFKPPVVIANHAEAGQTLKAFRTQRRWEKVMSLMKPGDYVFMQFGHNDLNKSGHDAMWVKEDFAADWVNTHSEANTDYQWLLAAYAVEVKRRGGIPVIVSPMTKLNLRTGELNVAGMGDYPKAARAAAQLADVAFIDLNAMSVEIMKSLGEALAPKAYVDGLHSNTYGGYLFARCIVEGARQAKLDLVKYLVDDAGTFDPTHPAPLPDDFKLPLDPKVTLPMPPGFTPRANRGPAPAGEKAPAPPPKS